MDDRLLWLYQRQVALQCQYALWAGEAIANELARGFAPYPHGRRAEVVHFGVQNAVVACANISKALWGQRDTWIEARQPLRESLSVRDDSALRQFVIRHHYEHYDERLARWWGESPTRNFTDLGIGNAIGQLTKQIGEEENGGVFRQFDTESWTVIFWGDRFELGAALTEIREDLLPRSQQQSDPMRLHSFNTDGGGE